MASIFTYDPNPPRVSSPWSTPGRATPQPGGNESSLAGQDRMKLPGISSFPVYLSETGIVRLEPEPHEGATEYKLHLLLRPRRTFSSMSTSKQVAGSQQSHAYLPKAGSRSTSFIPFQPTQPPTTLSRQTRLQQLTTQLLWRLQQSSPFHSCSTAGLVIANLPEATPKLGIPSKPASLLPGLEESQGALYELGVSDDGTFVGLTEDELDESLTNLKAMAASLGCVVDVLRKVIVGHGEWRDLEDSLDGSAVALQTGDLWVAEALVRPDLERSTQMSRTTSSLNRSPIMRHETLNGLEIPQPEMSRSKVTQLRVSLLGATTSGKSSLLGTLTNSTFDNGRGKSRLNLLKHRHEIASGVTSSVAQELLGYRKKIPVENAEHSTQALPAIINYASENVSSWNDIHSSASRLIFLSDSPGLPRYSKSTIRTVVSWKPHWTLICIAADCEDGEKSLQSPVSCTFESIKVPAPSPSAGSSADPLLVHLELCLKLNLPIVMVITKMDIATKLHLRQILSKLLSALKAAGKKPVLMSTSDSHNQNLNEQSVDLQSISLADEAEVERVTKMIIEMGVAVVPIVFTSAVTGRGVGKLHGLLRYIPLLAGTGETAITTASTLQLPGHTESSPKIFQVDEVFAMPPSKVYAASRIVDEADQGTVLCGYVSSSSICIGDYLSLGPFLVESNDNVAQRSNTLHRSMSFPNSTTLGRPPSHQFSKSIPPPESRPVSKVNASVSVALWQDVRVVSIRNLRLPTRSLLAGQVGTIGIEPISDGSSTRCDLRRARKGMILASCEDGEQTAYRSITVLFPASDFKMPSSPPLILGGHATIYINSIRASVRVTSVALAEDDGDTETSVRDEHGVFAFDGDDTATDEGKHIRIKFKFSNSVEWMRLDDKILVVPNAAAAGPVTGISVAATGGLNGFVGIICDLHV